ncbi:MAG: sensor histidine kinase [Xanthomonadales bacterium]|nr:sensor histidine kinase [Xanthomonadales bacterium]
MSKQQHEESLQVILPDFCRWQVLLTAVLMGEIVLLANALLHPQQMDWYQLGLSTLLIGALSILMISSLCWWRNWLNNFEGNRAWWVSWLLIVVSAVFYSWLGWMLLQRFGFSLPEVQQPGFSLRISLVVAMISAAMLRYLYIQQLWQQQTLSQTEARVQALQSRIRPHFLFNSLNSIVALIPEDPAKAEQATEDLADLFRSALRDTSIAGTLGDELEMVRKYLRIEHHRFGSRLQIDWQVDDLPTDARVPRLLLQPLVENAVAHGIEPSPNGGVVGISGACDGDFVVIVVNSPLTNSLPSRSGNQMAVANIRERLQYHYAGRASLSLNREEGQFQTILRFPYDAYSNS